MGNDSLLFLRAGSLMRRELVSCGVEEPLFAALDAMREKDVSSIVVLRDGRAAGILTDRDLRRRIPEIRASGEELSISALMSSPVHTLPADAHVFEVIHFWVRRNIHHAVLVDADGYPVGILSDTDILAAQMDSPIFFSRAIEEATSVEELRAVNQRMADMVALAYRESEAVSEVTRLITHFYDAITRRAIEVLLPLHAPHLADRFAFLVLGSEGRKEQTLKTDQDNAIVHDDDLLEPEVEALGHFVARLREVLLDIGVPLCPGGTTADKAEWRKSRATWISDLENWISNPSPGSLVNFGMFCDFRTIYGPTEHERRLKGTIHKTVARNQIFLTYMARNILRFPPPVGVWGRLKTELEGPHAGEIDLKKAGFFTLTEGLTLLALNEGFLEGSTLEKIETLRGRNAMAPKTADNLRNAYSFLLTLRLRHQLSQVKAGLPPDNFIDPKTLSAVDKAGLKTALKTLYFFQHHLRDKFQVDLIRL